MYVAGSSGDDKDNLGSDDGTTTLHNSSGVVEDPDTRVRENVCLPHDVSDTGRGMEGLSVWPVARGALARGTRWCE